MILDTDGFGPNAFKNELDVSRETIQRLDAILSLLREWSARINLIGPKERDALWRRHVYDSLQLCEHVDLDSAIVDLGAGAGFPGLVMAANMTGDHGHVTMVETVGKKCAFLREVINSVGLSASVRQGRVETCGEIEADFVTARAFAPMLKLMEYAAPWLLRGALGVFPKGRNWQEELTKAQESWRFAYEAIPSRSGGEGVILKVSEVSRVSK